MGLLDRLIGHADVNAKSSYNLERFLGEGEKMLACFRFARDEIAVTTHGVFTVDVQGIMGSKKEYKYFPLKGVKYVSYESAGTFDADADIKIGLDGNTELVNNVPVSKPLSFKIPKAQAAEGERFFKLLKAALDS
ncbi:PH domain-containing protein [Pyxidicoccus fallax]|uniref:PH domain-containing protein n=1 Tax=Pyxidicoccus fallax TaxID=394095 RepID=A0A848LE67_9BACT|nr:PH domain-containing protein [Pyxidicoccus fallax]NMO15093.1 PH domain-containing protein [Pyxidicoccus fallax]NPC79793.1 PH domain-containing protein [Pyxidicoccus fallax]